MELLLLVVGCVAFDVVVFCLLCVVCRVLCVVCCFLFRLLFDRISLFVGRCLFIGVVDCLLVRVC